MPRRKKSENVEEVEQPVEEQVIEEQPAEEQVVAELPELPTEEITSMACLQGYDFEVPTVHSLIVDAGTLALLLNGSFRPYRKYDQVLFQSDSIPEKQVGFSLYLAFRALRPGGLFWVRPELAGMQVFRNCPQTEMGGMVRITRK